jgi:hypothetical protein
MSFLQCCQRVDLFSKCNSGERRGDLIICVFAVDSWLFMRMHVE